MVSSVLGWYGCGKGALNCFMSVACCVIAVSSCTARVKFSKAKGWRKTTERFRDLFLWLDVRMVWL